MACKTLSGSPDVSALVRPTGFVLVAFAFLVVMVGTTLPTPLYPLYEAEFGFSGLVVTVIFAAYAVGVIAALVLFGDLSDRIGRKRTLLPGLGFAAVSAVCFLSAHGLALLLVGRVVSGLSAGVFSGTATATLVDLAPAGDRDRASLVATVVNMGGLGVGVLLGGVLAQWLPDPIRLVFFVDLALVALAALGLAGVTEPVEERGRLRIRPQGLAVPREVRAVFIRASLAAFAGFAVAGLFSAVAGAFLAKVLGITNLALIGGVVFCIFGGSIVGQLLRRRIADRTALAGGCATLVAGMGVLVLAVQLQSAVLLVLCALVSGVGQGLSFAAGVAMVAGGAPEDRRAAVTSSLFVVAYVGISLPVVGVGLLDQATSLVTGPTIFAVVVALLAAGAAMSLVRTRSPEPTR
jgi:MFS family permease